MSETVIFNQMDSKLEFLAGNLSGNSFILSNPRTAIGRNANNDVVLADNGVSGSHAQILNDGTGAFRIKDLNSTNGTYVNGNKITECVLRNGDVIEIRPHRIKFSGPGGTAAADSGGTMVLPSMGSSPNEPFAQPQQQAITVAARPQSDEMYCPHCAQIIKRSAVICIKCGSPLGEVRPANPYEHQQGPPPGYNQQPQYPNNYNQSGNYGNYNNYNNSHDTHKRPEEKNVGVAIVLNLLWSGLGYFYIGHTGPGVFFCIINLFLLPTVIGPLILFLITSADCANKINNENRER
ncbi:MAG: Glycogen accumulation regulator GarA [bacterium ADurb.Bin243]|nr:MAG: Glycogen accumulation regulator GarA [bacterium ADurb.Bin243]